MTSTTRVPKTEITGIYGGLLKRMTRKRFGDVPESAAVMWHYPTVFKDLMGFGRKADRWDRLDPNLASFAAMAAAGIVGCSCCVDLGYYMAHNRGLDEAKAREAPRWRESDAFSPLERSVMEYAEAMSQTPPTVTDETSAALLEDLGAPALVELTARIAAMNLNARTNIALGNPDAGILGGLWPAATRDPVADPSLLAMIGDPFAANRSLLFTVAYEMLGDRARPRPARPAPGGRHRRGGAERPRGSLAARLGLRRRQQPPHAHPPLRVARWPPRGHRRRGRGPPGGAAVRPAAGSRRGGGRGVVTGGGPGVVAVRAAFFECYAAARRGRHRSTL